MDIGNMIIWNHIVYFNGNKYNNDGKKLYRERVGEWKEWIIYGIYPHVGDIHFRACSGKENCFHSEVAAELHITERITDHNGFWQVNIRKIIHSL